jgi:hypothetical protein
MDLKSGTPALVYILFEHKSYPDAMVAFQLLRYVIAIWQRYLADGGGKPLPLIIPLVVYHGAEPWSVPVDFAALFEPDEALAGIVPDFRYFLSDLGAQADHELSRFALLRSGLMALKHATRGSDIVSIEAIVTAEIWHDLFCGVVIKYIFRAFRKIDRGEVARLLTTIKEKAGPIMVSNIAQEWIDEGKAQGLMQGMAQGEARLLTKLLSGRFGPLPAEVTARMEDADTDALETWAGRLLDARTLDEVFAPDKSSLS